MTAARELIWSAVTCHRLACFGDLSPKQGRVQRPGEVSARPFALDGDKSPAENADQSAQSKVCAGGAGRGFTLIELILVMAMLALVLALAAPSLSRFFKGRKIDSEARRFLSVTRYGQSRAVSEGVPMVLWVDTKQNSYGLEAENSYLGSDSKALTYTVDDTLAMEVESPRRTTLVDPFQAGSTIAGNRPFIRFQPDGFTSEDSATWVLLQQEEDESFVYIGQSRNRLNYEIKTNQIPVLRY